MSKQLLQNPARAWGVAVVMAFVAIQLVAGQAPPTTIELLQQRLADTDQRIAELQREMRTRQDVVVIANQADFFARLGQTSAVADGVRERLRRETAGLTQEQLTVRQAQINTLTQQLVARRGEMFQLETDVLRERVSSLQRQVDDLQRQLR